MACLLFYGSIASLDAFPRFRVSRYMLSPSIYLVSNMLSTASANKTIFCAPDEFVQMMQTRSRPCAQYMAEFVRGYGGSLVDGDGFDGTCGFRSYSHAGKVSVINLGRHADAWTNSGSFVTLSAVNNYLQRYYHRTRPNVGLL